MDKESLWNLYLLRNPAFGKEGQVTLTTAGLRKLFETTFDKGVEHGRSIAQCEPFESTPISESFKSIFRKL